MFQSNDDTKNEIWRARAREGDLVPAIMNYRALYGTNVANSRNAIYTWISEQPPGTCKPFISITDDEALAITLGLARAAVAPDGDDVIFRRNVKAIDRVNGIVNRLLDRDTHAQTGPIPSNQHIGTPNHHWLRNVNGEIVVMQWQPGQKKWCHSGRVGTASAVDTLGWTYVAPCPMPLLDGEQTYLEGLHEELQASNRPITMTERMAFFLRGFLAEFRR